MVTLGSSLDRLKGVGPQIEQKLSDFGLKTLSDLLFYLPLRYEDRSKMVMINELTDEVATFQATVTSISSYYKRGRSIQRARVVDTTGSAQLMWFNTPYIVKQLQKGQTYSFSGKLNARGSVVHPSVERLTGDTIHTGRLVPLYSTKIDMAQGRLRRIIKTACDALSATPTAFDAAMVEQSMEYPTLEEALRELHFPNEEDAVITARERLALEELAGLILHSKAMKKIWEENAEGAAVPISGQSIPESIPFTLTESQERVISEIVADIQTSTPMNRIVTGDVGSGKTVVAGVAAYHTVAAGHYAALVAPTKLLAEQHAQTLASLFPTMPIHVRIGAKKTPLPSEPCLVVGTHAVIHALQNIQPTLLIYDEQHRFGVNQRSQALALSSSPHILTMTATPIPRSMILSLFSHLDISRITELPANRIPTKTWVLPDAKRKKLYTWLEKQHQENTSFLSLFVCPYIQASEEPNGVVDAETRFIELKKAFPKLRVALLHGKQSEQEKQKITQQLFQDEVDILVTTTIVEVGIDLPQASVMVIESAQQYGLASLHQLRGRVGRAGQQGYCYLFHSSRNEETIKRLEFFSQTNDGAAVAEFDLHRRGAGDLFGTKQHGFDTLRFASWTNTQLISDAHNLVHTLPPDWKPHPQLAPQVTTEVLHN